MIYLIIGLVLLFYILCMFKKIKYYFYNFIINDILYIFIDFSIYLSSYKKYKKDKYIMSRVNYYNKINQNFNLHKINPINLHEINPNFNKKDIYACDSIKNILGKIKRSAYYYDFKDKIKFFNTDKYVSIIIGDIRDICNQPTLSKTRTITNSNNNNNIILKWNYIRHYRFIEDKLLFENKLDMLVWRGCIDKIQDYTGIRRFLITNFESNKLMNINYKNYITIEEQMKYKFILSIEGYDVATNLKWIMNSNSLCFMPKPTCESWFMEGTLIPGYHYVEIKNDLSDLEDKIKYYILNLDECKRIIKNANNYVEQFKDTKREKIIEILILDKYFDMVINNNKKMNRTKLSEMKTH